MIEEIEGKIIAEKICEELKPAFTLAMDLDEIVLTFPSGTKLTEHQIRKHIQVKIVNDLKGNPKLNHFFDIDKLRDTDWNLLVKYVTIARMEELNSVKVVRRKKKYGISELRKTYYGKLMLDDLDKINKRRQFLSNDEYQQIKLACRKLNLELPEVIEPTTTEKFFEEFNGGNNNE